MGSAGIKRRKNRRAASTLPTDSISAGDVDRLFGRFTWSPYSPAGGLERNGFLWRQLRRRGKRDGWTYVAYAVFAIFAFPLALGLIVFVVNLSRWL